MFCIRFASVEMFFFFIDTVLNFLHESRGPPRPGGVRRPRPRPGGPRGGNFRPGRKPPNNTTISIRADPPCKTPLKGGPGPEISGIFGPGGVPGGPPGDPPKKAIFGPFLGPKKQSFLECFFGSKKS